MYHRVLPANDPRVDYEEPAMIVTPETFRRHLCWLGKRFEIVSLSEWIEHRKTGVLLPETACAITFDDGWRDNYEFAFPILLELQVPATIFAVSDMVGTRKVFWPNRLARLLKAGWTPNDTLLGEQLSRAVPSLTAHPPSRSDIARAIDACKPLTEKDIFADLSQLEAQHRLSPSPDRELADWDELRTMIRSGWVEIGSHGCDHQRLSDALSPAELEAQVVDSRRRLEQMLESSVRLFCYPNGIASKRVSDLVRANYMGAVTTVPVWNTSETPDHELGRLGVHEDISRSRVGLMARLSGWV